ncbi:ABC transporter substrate-binding protein [Candidatus Poribacteria bacterium]
MTKSEKLFEMLELIKEYPNLNARDLARLCDVSERGVYRYINTLSKADISVRLQDGGYRLQDDYSDIFRKSDPDKLEALRDLLSLGIQNCQNDRTLEYGREFMELVAANLPRSRRQRPDEIEIVSEEVKAAYPGGAIAIGHSSKPAIINPILTSETISVSLMNLIFSNLVKFDATNMPIPDVAESWEVSDDGQVWTFFLRKDVKFHDGHPLTAHDVEFTYRSIMDPKNMSPLAERYELVDEIGAEGDYVFRVELKYPFAPFIHWMGRAIAPKHLLENSGLHNTPFNRNPVGSGPFKLTDWTEDDDIILDANKEYFLEGRPVLDRLIFKAYPDRKSALKAISSGKMDIALDLAASDLMFVSKNGAFRAYPTSNSYYYAIILNLSDPLFEDIRVRKALDHAIDRDSVIKNQLKGYSKVCTGPFGVDSWGYNPNVQPAPYDVETARKLLEQAGWQDTDGDGILDKDGEPFEISLIIPNISDSLERIAVAIRAQLIKAGIKVKMEYSDEPVLKRKPFQAILAKFSTGADPDYTSKFWHSNWTESNLASYENSTVDKLLEQGRQTGDLEKRKAIYHELHETIHDDYPAIFLASACDFVGSNYRFGSARFSSLLHFLNTMKDWQIVNVERRDMVHERRREVSTAS